MLKIGFKDKKNSAVWLVEPKLTIGSATDNDLVIANAGVADHHIEILVDHEQLTLVNSKSTNEVSVNGMPVADSCPVSSRDIISLAGLELEIIDPKGSAKPKAAAKPSTTAAPAAAASVRKTAPRVAKVSGWAIKANHKALQNRVYPINKTSVIGRSSDCDICLSATHLSRRHAELSLVNGVLHVKDLGSANGTYLNGKRVTEAQAKRGDELRLDTLCFGVIGPVDDMAKTTVRSVMKKPAPTAPQASAKAKAAIAATKTAHTPVDESFDEDKPRKGGIGLAVLVVLAVVVVAALYFTRT